MVRGAWGGMYGIKDMTIRTAAITDFEKIAAIERQIFNLHSNARPDLIDKNKTFFNFEYFKKCIEDENYKIYAAEENNIIMGFCILQKKYINGHSMFFDMTNLEIEDLCVDKDYRNKGIGKKLFETVLKYSKEEGIKRIELSVWEFNKNAKNFYAHLGMKTRISKMEIEVK
jgi:ribosomal protein S18 acetylase RimI-like enzyme